MEQRYFILFALIATLSPVAQNIVAQPLTDVPDEVKNRVMDMTAPLEEPSFDMDTTTVRVHLVGWEPDRKGQITFLTINYGSFFPYIADNASGLIDRNGTAIVRLYQRGTSHASIGISNYITKYFYLYPGETLDVYLDLERLAEPSDAYRKNGARDYDFANKPVLYFKGHYADLNTALQRYIPWKDWGWENPARSGQKITQERVDSHYENVLTSHQQLKEQIENDQRLPRCARELWLLANDVKASHYLMMNAQMKDALAARRDSASFNDYVHNRPYTPEQMEQFRRYGSNTNKRAYFRSIELVYTKIEKFWDAITDGLPCDYLHDLRIVKGYPDRIAHYGKLPDGAMKDVRMPYFQKLISQLETAEEGLPHERYSEVLEELKQKYRGKVVLIDFWATWCHGCLQAMDIMEPKKDTQYNRPDLAFVYITDPSSPADRWRTVKEKYRGDHLRVTKPQMDELNKRFAITALPCYVIMNRKGVCRIVESDHVEEELNKELNNTGTNK